MSPSVSTAKELLARFVAFDTTSSKTNIPLIDFVETYLAGHGIESHRVPTSDGLEASLFASIGPAHGGALALSGHNDVVPVVDAELGELVAGLKPARASEEETFVFDSTGTALQDVAAAVAVYRRALRQAGGFRFSLNA